MADGKRTSTGVLFALCSIFIVQIGAAASTPVFAAVGPAGTAWLRLCWAAVFFVAVARPSLRSLRRRDLAAAVLLGVVSAGMTVTFFEAIARIPLATAVAIEFLGPLTVAVLRRTGRWGLVWPPLAFAGVLLVTQPWSGLTDPVGIGFALGAGLCWASYILLTQRIGERFHGLAGLAISMPAAALAATPVGLVQALGHVTPMVVLACAGLALLAAGHPVLARAVRAPAPRRGHVRHADEHRAGRRAPGGRGDARGRSPAGDRRSASAWSPSRPSAPRAPVSEPRWAHPSRRPRRADRARSGGRTARTP